MSSGGDGSAAVCRNEGDHKETEWKLNFSASDENACQGQVTLLEK